MRLDRSLTIHFGHTISRIANRRSLTGIPILMYHSIRDVAQSVHPYYEINTSPAMFGRHMEFLKESGYTSVGLEEAVKHSGDRKPGWRPVVITFDDGFLDFYSTAFPILRQHGFSATVFIPTGLLSDQRSQWKGADLMTWSEVRELQACGVRFGSHTVSHPELERLDDKQVSREVSQSRQTLEDKLGIPIKAFAYPYAFPEHNKAFTRRLGGILESHGYEVGVSTVIGRARSTDNPFFLPRLPINTWDDLALFQAKLEGGYDWLHWPQWIYKQIQHYVRPGASLPVRQAV